MFPKYNFMKILTRVINTIYKKLKKNDNLKVKNKHYAFSAQKKLKYNILSKLSAKTALLFVHT